MGARLEKAGRIVCAEVFPLCMRQALCAGAWCAVPCSAMLCLEGLQQGFCREMAHFHGVLVLPRHSCMQGTQHEVVSPLLACNKVGAQCSHGVGGGCGSRPRDKAWRQQMFCGTWDCFSILVGRMQCVDNITDGGPSAQQNVTGRVLALSVAWTAECWRCG